jgi:hypothetical protein
MSVPASPAAEVEFATPGSWVAMRLPASGGQGPLTRPGFIGRSG